MTSNEYCQVSESGKVDRMRRPIRRSTLTRSSEAGSVWYCRRIWEATCWPSLICSLTLTRNGSAAVGAMLGAARSPSRRLRRARLLIFARGVYYLPRAHRNAPPFLRRSWSPLIALGPPAGSLTSRRDALKQRNPGCVSPKGAAGTAGPAEGTWRRTDLPRARHWLQPVHSRRRAGCYRRLRDCFSQGERRHVRNIRSTASA